MKKILTILGALLLVAMPMKAQDGEYAVFAPISKYIAAGDASSLSRWFADHLDVTIISSSRSCSQSQARQILKSFFESYTPRSFEITHKAAESNRKYVVGNLNAGGEIFLVTIYATAGSDETYKIQQLVVSRQTAVF